MPTTHSNPSANPDHIANEPFTAQIQFIDSLPHHTNPDSPRSQKLNAVLEKPSLIASMVPPDDGSIAIQMHAVHNNTVHSTPIVHSVFKQTVGPHSNQAPYAMTRVILPAPGEESSRVLLIDTVTGVPQIPTDRNISFDTFTTGLPNHDTQQRAIVAAVHTSSGTLFNYQDRVSVSDDELQAVHRKYEDELRQREANVEANERRRQVAETQRTEAEERLAQLAETQRKTESEHKTALETAAREIAQLRNQLASQQPSSVAAPQPSFLFSALYSMGSIGSSMGNSVYHAFSDCLSKCRKPKRD